MVQYSMLCTLLTCIFFIMPRQSAAQQALRQSEARAQLDDATAREAEAVSSRVKEFFAAYQRQDAARLYSLWDDSSKDLPSFQANTYTLFTHEQYRIEVSAWQIQFYSGSSTPSARVYVAVNLTLAPISSAEASKLSAANELSPKADAGDRSLMPRPLSQPPYPNSTRQLLLLREISLVKTDQWRISHYGSAANSFVQLLVTQPTQAAAGRAMHDLLPDLKTNPAICSLLQRDLLSICESANERCDLLPPTEVASNKNARRQVLRVMAGSALLAAAADDKAGVFWDHLAAGRAYLALALYAAAEQELSQAVTADRSLVISQAVRQWQKHYWPYYYLTLAQLAQNKQQQALQTIHEIMPAVEKAQDRGWTGVFEALRGQTLARTRPAASLSSLQRSIRFKTDVTINREATRMKVLLADAYTATDHYREAGRLYKEAQDDYKAWRDDTTLANCQIGLGLTLTAQNSDDLAVLKVQDALERYRLLHYRPGIAAAQLALITIYNHLAAGSYGVGARRYKGQARQSGTEALGMFKTLSDPEGVFFTIIALHNTGASLSRKDWNTVDWALRQRVASPAIQAFGSESRLANSMLVLTPPVQPTPRLIAACQKMQALAETRGHVGWVTAARLNFAIALLAARRGAEAWVWAQKARQAADISGSLELQWRTARTLGEAALALHHPIQAMQAFRTAVSDIEQTRDLVAGNEEDQQRYFADKAGLYRQLMLLYAARYSEHKHVSDAFATLSLSEGVKGRTIVDAVSRGRVPLSASLDGAERDQYNRSLHNLSATLSRQPSMSGAAATQWRDKRLELALFYEPLAHSGAVQNFVSARQLASLLRQPDMALVEYCVTEKQTLLFLLTRQPGAVGAQAGIEIFSIPISRREMERRCQRISELVSNPLAYTNYARDAEQFSHLFLPLRALDILRRKKTVVIVPDGALWNVPFHALVTTPRGNSVIRYWIEDSAISYVYSLTWLWQQRQKHRQQRWVPLDLLVVGNVTPEEAAREHQQKVATLRPRTALAAHKADATNTGAFSRTAEELKPCYPPLRSLVQQGDRAIRRNFEAMAWKARVLHFPVHGVLDDHEPMNSFLKLYPAKGQERLTAWDVAEMQLNAEIAILAGCETSKGKAVDGEGLVGLTWAFSLAGCGCTIGSQWAVDRDPTDALMLCFHRLLGNQLRQSGSQVTKAQLWQRAVRAIMADPKHTSWQYPAFWAGFRVVGDGGALRPVSGTATRPLTDFKRGAKKTEAHNAPDCRLEVQLTAGQEVFGRKADVYPGDAVSFCVWLGNKGTAVGHKPRIRFLLPQGIEYCPGTGYILTKHDNQNYLTRLLDKRMLRKGNKIGWQFDDMDANASASLYLIFQAQVRRHSEAARQQPFHFVGGDIPITATCSFSTQEARTNQVVVRIKSGKLPQRNCSVRIELANLSLRRPKQEWKSYHECPVAAVLNDKLRCIVRVINTGNVDLDRMLLRLVLPPGIQFVGNVRMYSSQGQVQRLAGNALVQTGLPLLDLKSAAGDARTVVCDVQVCGPLHYSASQSSIAAELVDTGTSILKRHKEVQAFLDATECLQAATSGKEKQKAQQTLDELLHIHSQEYVFEAHSTVAVFLTKQRGVNIIREIYDPSLGEYTTQPSHKFIEGDTIRYRIHLQNCTPTTIHDPVCRLNVPLNAAFVVGSLRFDGAPMPSGYEPAWYSSGTTITDMVPGFCQTISFDLKLYESSVEGNTTLPVYVSLHGNPVISARYYGLDASLAFH